MIKNPNRFFPLGFQNYEPQNKRTFVSKSNKSLVSTLMTIGDVTAGGGGGVLPYETLTGTCGPIGYGFQGVLS